MGRLLNNINLGLKYLCACVFFYFVWSNTVCFQVGSYGTSHYTTYISSYRQEREKDEVRPMFYTHFCSLGQIIPQMFHVSLSLVSVYHCASACCFITRLEVLEGKLSMKRLKRSRGWKKTENKEINLTSLTAISLLHSAPQSKLTLSNF